MSEERKPGIRIHNGVRRDLNKERIASRMAGLAPARPAASDKASRAEANERRAKAERRAARTGCEGATTTEVRTRISGSRAASRVMRSKPGTFEWNYGRNRQDALFHAGSHLAQLWERAGIAVASSADFLRGTGSGYATGVSDGRLAAIDQLQGFKTEMGRLPSERLISYCVLGMTSREIAEDYQMTQREIAPVLHSDLRACAFHFRFMGNERRQA